MRRRIGPQLVAEVQQEFRFVGHVANIEPEPLGQQEQRGHLGVNLQVRDGLRYPRERAAHVLGLTTERLRGQAPGVQFVDVHADVLRQPAQVRLALVHAAQERDKPLEAVEPEEQRGRLQRNVLKSLDSRIRPLFLKLGGFSGAFLLLLLESLALLGGLSLRGRDAGRGLLGGFGGLFLALFVAGRVQAERDQQFLNDSLSHFAPRLPSVGCKRPRSPPPRGRTGPAPRMLFAIRIGWLIGNLPPCPRWGARSRILSGRRRWRRGPHRSLGFCDL